MNSLTDVGIREEKGLKAKKAAVFLTFWETDILLKTENKTKASSCTLYRANSKHFGCAPKTADPK